MKKSYLAGSPGAAVIAVRDGKVVYRKAVGMADLELDVPLSPDSVFRLGSVTKQFTAVAILMLAEEGKLALSDPITKFLPDYPTQGHVITVEHLLTHTSGIQSYTGMPGWMATKIQADMTLTELIDGFKKEPMEFAPGTRWSYDNSGYVLLGAIIEKASGTPYATFLQRRIFDPLGMTVDDLRRQRGDHPAAGPRLLPRRRGDANARYLSMTQPYAAGALVSTVDDLAAWDAALYTEKLVKQASLEKAWTPYVLADGKATKYGYGWSVEQPARPADRRARRRDLRLLDLRPQGPEGARLRRGPLQQRRAEDRPGHRGAQDRGPRPRRPVPRERGRGRWRRRSWPGTRASTRSRRTRGGR